MISYLYFNPINNSGGLKASNAGFSLSKAISSSNTVPGVLFNVSANAINTFQSLY